MSFVLDLQAMPDRGGHELQLKPSTWSWFGCFSNASVAAC
ncbi:SapB/AmfS family lanthipeptide [Nocardiopsis sp. ATB16-24]|nr:SapB/AmfS family lanthipeptide [Nocardiopsis sp. ATB16-24]